MANTTSAKKAIRVMARKTAINKTRRSRVRTFMRKLDEAIAAGNYETATEALRAAQAEMMRAAQKGIFHKKTASRKISRLSKRVKALSA
ncbi:MAG: 30S ribosomal protein S20 [OCS116 cluster bacterium]|uniref:Small ribosomal subunit protein bS20 n=1 Tax=OCS116 cluster bacterium TaxID=2030921 RepID=A0A2A4YQ20_9PROT|nr:30S ribosomal protein S20 [OCS116 cluster bacterium]